MDIYDSEAVRRVWSRVSASQEEQLAAMIAAERHAHASYRLFAKSFPRYRAFFHSLSEAEAQHARLLSQLFELLYGRKAEAAVKAAKRPRSLREAIRESYAAELSAAQSYRNASAEFPMQSQLFLSLAADEARHADRLRTLPLPK